MAEKPETLILGSRYDLTCDFVVAALRRKGVSYLRLNSEDLSSTHLELDPAAATLRVVVEGNEFLLSESGLRSVLFRRPTFLRCYGDSSADPETELVKAHWAAFMRNLILFEAAIWVNHPKHTYVAEHKALQLRLASSLGFAVPRTRVANTAAAIAPVAAGQSRIVVKGLDAVLVREGEQERFGFTQIVEVGALEQHELNSAPMILQEALHEKIDLRVTIVGDSVFAVEITRHGEPIAGDWRCASREVAYRPVRLPEDVEQKCIELVKSLRLRFGAVDLARQGDRYYFLEINPTGEWAWLIDAAGLAIDEAVAALLTEAP